MARRRSITAVVAAVIVSIRRPIGSRELAWGAGAQGVGTGDVGVLRRAMTGETVESRYRHAQGHRICNGVVAWVSPSENVSLVVAVMSRCLRGHEM